MMDTMVMQCKIKRKRGAANNCKILTINCRWYLDNLYKTLKTSNKPLVSLLAVYMYMSASFPVALFPVSKHCLSRLLTTKTIYYKIWVFCICRLHRIQLVVSIVYSLRYSYFCKQSCLWFWNQTLWLFQPNSSLNRFIFSIVFSNFFSCNYQLIDKYFPFCIFKAPETIVVESK